MTTVVRFIGWIGGDFIFRLGSKVAWVLCGGEINLF